MFDLDNPGMYGQTLGFLQESAGWTPGLKQVFIDLGAESLDRMLKRKDAKAPSLCMLEVNGDTQLGYVVYDVIDINATANGPLEALLALLAVYYTFDPDYPKVYSQTLDFYKKVLGEQQVCNTWTSTWVRSH